MELHTPNNTGQSFSAGHVPKYLEGLINTIFLDELKINPEEHIPHYGVSVSYMDYVVVEPIEISAPTPMSRDGGGDDDNVMSIKIFQKAVAKEEHRIKCTPEDNPAIQIQKHLSDKVLDQILALSQKNKDEMSEHFPTGLDLQITKDDNYSDKRKLVSRILTAANLIASKGRRGPATFIMIGKDYVDYLRQDVQDDCAFQSMSEIGNFAYGMNIFVSGKLGNTVVVGRCPTMPEEPGLHLITTHKDIEGDIVMDSMGVTDVDVVYMLTETGSAPQRNYLQFNILDHVD